jgi:hypothetical protein
MVSQLQYNNFESASQNVPMQAASILRAQVWHAQSKKKILTDKYMYVPTMYTSLTWKHMAMVMTCECTMQTNNQKRMGTARLGTARMGTAAQRQGTARLGTAARAGDAHFHIKIDAYTHPYTYTHSEILGTATRAGDAHFHIK